MWEAIGLCRSFCGRRFYITTSARILPVPAFPACRYCRLCLLEGSEEDLRARYAIILKQRAEAHKRLEEAKATVKYMDSKAAHYEAVLAGLAPDDTNPRNWTAANRPKHEGE